MQSSSRLYIVGSILFAGVLIVGALMFTGSKKPKTAEASDEPKIQHVHGLAVDVANPDRLLIATHHGLLQLMGESELTRLGAGQDDLMGFTPHPSDPAIYFSSGHPVRGGNLGFQKSTDGGNTWQKLSDGIDGPVDFHSMTVSTVNPDLAYGFFGTLQRSEDGGKTWSVINGPVQPISMASDPKRESVVYAATQNGVLVSEDKAESWKSLSKELEGGPVSVYSPDPTGEYALTYSLKLGGMGKSTDGGATWQKAEETFGGEVVMLIAHAKSESRAYALTESNAIYKSTDKGESWSKVR